MWNIKGIKQMSTKLCAFKIAPVIIWGEKEESVEIGGVSFLNTPCCVKTFAPKTDVEQTYEYNA